MVKVGSPAISPLETRSFPTPSHDGCGFIQLSGTDQKAGANRSSNNETFVASCYD